MNLLTDKRSQDANTNSELIAKILPQKFYQQDTEKVAKALLGKTLVHLLPDGRRLSGKIVETEAYIGAEDAACHGFNHHKTKRTLSLYQPGGFSYVYLIYGMYFCFNVVTKTEHDPEAVLIRALEPLEGQDYMKNFRRAKKLKDLTNGPGKLCQAMKINKGLDRVPLFTVSTDQAAQVKKSESRSNGHKSDQLKNSRLHIEESSFQVRKSQIVTATRIGVDYAGEAAQWPLRFYLKENPFVSKF